MAEADQDHLLGQSVGERLRIAREAKKLSLDDVARQTRIPVRHLEHIERGEWEALPAITYSVGFVRSYGNAVGLVNVLDILLDKTRSPSLARYTRRIITAADGEPAYRIIRRLRAARLGLAAVVDAQKKLVGIATDEELIKRLVQSA